MNSRVCPAFAFAVIACIAAPAAHGAVGELTLDRAAISDLLAGALPATLAIEVGGSGFDLALGRPREVAFVEGGIEAVFGAWIEQLGVGSDLRVRFEPRLEPRYGGFRLEAVRAEVLAMGSLDVSALFPPAELPRRGDWTLDLDGGRKIRVTCHVQDVVVEEERLRLDLGLTVRSEGAAPDGARSPRAGAGRSPTATAMTAGTRN